MSEPAVSSTSRRNVAIATGVVLFHVAALWALQTGLLRRAVELVVPVEVFTEVITPPTPRVEPPPQPRPAQAVPQPAVRKPVAPPPAPRLQAAPELPPAPNAPVAAPDPQPAPPPIAAPVAIAPAPAPPPAPAKVELPSSSADYLQNPKPAYPPVSKRLGEQGKVVLRVLIGADGNAQDAEIKQSSGFDRLDKAGLETVRKWRYVPGKRGGVPEAMWFDVPIQFVLE
jgi:protein TonB